MWGAARRLARCDLELVAWLAGLSWLALHDPGAAGTWSLCPLRAAGFAYCPGCGLGAAICCLLHGDLAGSWQAHPLGIPAAAVLIGRTGLLLRRHGGSAGLGRPRAGTGQPRGRGAVTHRRSARATALSSVRSLHQRTEMMANIMQFLPELEGEEMPFVQGLIKDLDDNQAQMFAAAYRARRKDPQLILLTSLLGFLGLAGVQRFILGQIGMGLLYLFTVGFCLIGTIIDLVNSRRLAFEANVTIAQQVASTVRSSA